MKCSFSFDLFITVGRYEIEFPSYLMIMTWMIVQLDTRFSSKRHRFVHASHVNMQNTNDDDDGGWTRCPYHRFSNTLHVQFSKKSFPGIFREDFLPENFIEADGNETSEFYVECFFDLEIWRFLSFVLDRKKHLIPDREKLININVCEREN